MIRSIVIVILVALSALPFVIFLLLMAAVFFGSWDAEKTNEKRIGTLSALVCPACDRIYGVETAELARQEHIDRCEETRKANPGTLINFVRYWVVRCPNCHTTARFDYETESLDS
jgi:flagellar biosynthesis component FlhA